jgi:hypothetical protein
MRERLGCSDAHARLKCQHALEQVHGRRLQLWQ